jgi:hypothetical protein
VEALVLHQVWLRKQTSSYSGEAKMIHICQHKFKDGKMVAGTPCLSPKELQAAWDRLVPWCGEEYGFYRCGWCGQPTDPKGVVLELVLIPDGSVGDWHNAKLVNGECCPYGNEEVWPEDRVF